MGFLFSSSKKKSSASSESSDEHHHHVGDSKTTSPRDKSKSPSRTTLNYHPFIKKMGRLTKNGIHHMKKSQSSQQVPATPANANNSTYRSTPATTLIDGTYEPEHNSGFEIHYRDTVTLSMLEEQERIRQQLFYEEEGVEVTAQFKKPDRRSTSMSQQPPPRKQQSARTAVQHHRTTPFDEEEEEKKEEGSVASSPSPPQTQIHVVSTEKRTPQSPASPLGTPILDYESAESDPATMFPAIAAAQAKAKEAQQLKRNASAGTVSAASGTVSAASTNVAVMATTITKTVPVVTPTGSSPDKPFDESSPGNKPFDEDPTIREIENALKKGSTATKQGGGGSIIDNEVTDREVDLFDEELASGAVGCTGAVGATIEKEMEETSRKLLNAFNCSTGDDFTEVSGSALHQNHGQGRSCRLVDSFYDTTGACGTGTYMDATNMKRPYYDEHFARRFLKDITEDGLNVLWHLPPDDEESQADSANWSGRSVVMKIKPGSCYSTNDVEPKLTWTTLGGGKDDQKIARCLLPLLKIQSVSTFRDDYAIVGVGDEIKEEEQTGTSCGINLSRMEDDDVCLFAITTTDGDIQVFEAASPRERDVLVTGLKNVIARLCFHVIVGDAGASSELYFEEDKNPPAGELPSISSPVQNMNRIAHALLD